MFYMWFPLSAEKEVKNCSQNLDAVTVYWEPTLRSIPVCSTEETSVVLNAGGKMVMFQLSGKPTPSTKSVMDKIEKLTSQDIIGSGGYGTVYKLTLDNQSEFAVKKLARGGLERERGFERELETLADLKHKNLVTLRGYYSAPHINVLVYDLMRNGSLDTWLHGEPWFP